MNTLEMAARINDLDEKLRGAFGLSRSRDAANLYGVITMSPPPPIEQSLLIAFLQGRSTMS